MSDHDETLNEWTARLAAALDIPESAIDRDAVLALAGSIAHAVVRPAAPLTTYLVGYAAGRAAERGDVDSFAELAELVRQLADRPATS